MARDSTIEQLRKQIEHRDQVIVDLLERVEALERRVGVRPATEADESAGRTARRAPGVAVQAEAPRPSSAPGEVVVDEGAAERALERSLTQTGGLLLRAGQIEASPSFSYARNEDATPVFVSMRGGTAAGERERNADGLTADLALRLGLPWDAQLELGMPYRWRNVENVTMAGFTPVGTSSTDGAGFGDVRVGAAKTLLRESLWRPDLVGRFTWDTDSGEARDDGVSLGGGFDELRGSLTAIKRHDPVVFVGSVAYEHVLEDDGVEPGASVSSSFGGFIALSPETSLRLLFSGSYRGETEVLGTSVDGSEQVVGSFLVGGSTLLVPGLLLDLSVGIGLSDDADDFSVTLALPLRFDWQGW